MRRICLSQTNEVYVKMFDNFKDLLDSAGFTVFSRNSCEEFVNESGYLEAASVSKETEVPGDFSPSGLWAVLDDLLPDLDLSPPEKKKKE